MIVALDDDAYDDDDWPEYSAGQKIDPDDLEEGMKKLQNQVAYPF